MQRSVYDYFQQACRRELRPFPDTIRYRRQGDAQAAFVLRANAEQRIESAEYRCTTCVTLVALCEHLAQEVCGATIQRARTLTPDYLLNLHPEIPDSRHARAELALGAVQEALQIFPL
jgi:hypothetical protein